MIAVVGTRAATIEVYLVDSHTGLLPPLERSCELIGLWKLFTTDKSPETVSIECTNLPRSGPSTFTDLYICESVKFLCTASSSFLACGLRGGSLQTYKIMWFKGKCHVFNRICTVLTESKGTWFFTARRRCS